MSYFYKEPPKPIPYVQIFEHKAEDSCERIANGTMDFVLIDTINCVSNNLDGYIATRNAMGSIASVSLIRFDTPVLSGTASNPLPGTYVFNA